MATPFSFWDPELLVPEQSAVPDWVESYWTCLTNRHRKICCPNVDSKHSRVHRIPSRKAESARLGGSRFCPGARAHSAHALFLLSLWLNSSFRRKLDYYSPKNIATFFFCCLIICLFPFSLPSPFIASGLAEYDTGTAGPGHFHSTLDYSMLPGCGLEGGSTLVNSARKYNSGNIVPCASKFQMPQFETLTVTPMLTVHFP